MGSLAVGPPAHLSGRTIKYLSPTPPYNSEVSTLMEAQFGANQNKQHLAHNAWQVSASVAALGQDPSTVFSRRSIATECTTSATPSFPSSKRNSNEAGVAFVCTYGCRDKTYPDEPRSFGQKSDMVKHERAFHEGQKRYFCRHEGCGVHFEKFWTTYGTPENQALLTDFYSSGDWSESFDEVWRQSVWEQSFDEFKKLQEHQKLHHRNSHRCPKDCPLAHEHYFEVPLKYQQTYCPFPNCNTVLESLAFRRDHVISHMMKGDRLVLSPETQDHSLNGGQPPIGGPFQMQNQFVEQTYGNKPPAALFPSSYDNNDLNLDINDLAEDAFKSKVTHSSWF